MQIRLTVVDPLGSPDRARTASCDVLVTAPVGTALAAIASALASAVSGSDGPVVLYAGGDRLDAQRATLGEPPLIDGGVLSLGAPVEPESHPELDDAPTQLHVVAGPDAGGVHLLHGGQIHLGRSADADVPLDDPDVSRLHCAVTVGPDGRVSVADLGSTNGTTLDGTRVGTRPVRLIPGALLRIGESALRLAPGGGPRIRTAPDGEGHVRVSPAASDGQEAAHARVPAADGPGTPPGPPSDRTHHAYGSASWGASGGAPGSAGVQGHGSVEPPVVVPGQGGAPLIESRGGSASGGSGDTHGGRSGIGPLGDAMSASPGAPAEDPAGEEAPDNPGAGRRKGTPLRGTDVPQGLRRRGGLTAWARRLAGGRGEQDAAEPGTSSYDSPDSPGSYDG
ncbi:FHA domain-containing protein, partial [Streptomyces fulvoviolaceus]|uniref:FHA domain-containing protein n=1 Tax=Streptomyces fulvoviolaceus TaxID=285535 RepID=UPI0021C09AC4